MPKVAVCREKNSKRLNFTQIDSIGIAFWNFVRNLFIPMHVPKGSEKRFLLRVYLVCAIDFVRNFIPVINFTRVFNRDRN